MYYQNSVTSTCMHYVITSVTCIVDIINIDRKFIRSFWSQKISEKCDLEIYFFFTLEIYCDFKVLR